MGRGLFMELIECDVPLQLLDDKPNTQSIVIGELTIKEDLMPKTSQTGLEIARSVKSKRAATQDGASTCGHSTYTSGTRSYQSHTKKDSRLTQIMKILVVKMNIPDPNKSYQVTQQQLLQLPKSRYRPDDYLENSSSPQLEAVLTTSSIHGDSDATLPYSSSDKTIPYWTLSDDNAPTSQSPLNKHNKIDSTTNIKGIKNQKKPSKCRFNISVYGIRKYCRHYYLKCAETSCNRTFNKVQDWNTHHRMMHKHKLKCELCGRKFVTPSTHRGPQKLSCTTQVHLCPMWENLCI